MDRPALLDLDLVALVDHLAEQVEDAAERHVAHRHRDGAAGVAHLDPAGQTIGGVHGHGPDAVVAEVLLDLEDQAASLAVAVVGVELDLERVVDLGQIIGEGGLDDHALDLLDGPDAAPGLAVALLLAGLLFLLGLGSGFHESVSLLYAIRAHSAEPSACGFSIIEVPRPPRRPP